ncbi:DUF4192 family protein [Micromonospora sp. b486]|uniref:DUF4192 family protein n=1 Tax=Micromonospora sp. b486 TaxID=3053986 RepID=UPI00338E0501
MPYLLGFHPADSVVGGRGTRPARRLRRPWRPAGTGCRPRPAARHLAQVVARQDADAATVVATVRPPG